MIFSKNDSPEAKNDGNNEQVLITEMMHGNINGPFQGKAWVQKTGKSIGELERPFKCQRKKTVMR
jgi:hypothetical protein